MFPHHGMLDTGSMRCMRTTLQEGPGLVPWDLCDIYNNIYVNYLIIN